MARVIGIDPGTITIDLCGLDDGRVFLDRSIPTSEALASPAVIVGVLEGAGPLDLIAGPSGYGLPLKAAKDLTDSDLRLAYLAAEGEPGGIRGLRALMRALASSSLPLVLTPGVIHLPSVPMHRKVNRVDMGTADKVGATALAISEHAVRHRCTPADARFILLELGGAFSAAIAVDEGRIVDGLGGSSGPIGVRAAGALDGEVAFLAGSISKEMLFHGGVATVALMHEASIDDLAAARTARAQIAWEAFIENAVKAVASLTASVPKVAEIVLSGRASRIARVRDGLLQRLATSLPNASVESLRGFASAASHAAQGAALIADGLAGGSSAPLVERLAIREAAGTVLDHLHAIDAAAARARLGFTE